MRKPILITIIAGAAALLIAGIITTVILVTSNSSTSSSDAAPTAGCTETTTKEIYVQHVYDCPDGTRVYTFADTTARDNYLKTAEGFGTTTIAKGTTWARVRI